MDCRHITHKTREHLHLMLVQLRDWNSLKPLPQPMWLNWRVVQQHSASFEHSVTSLSPIPLPVTFWTLVVSKCFELPVIPIISVNTIVINFVLGSFVELKIKSKQVIYFYLVAGTLLLFLLLLFVSFLFLFCYSSENYYAFPSLFISSGFMLCVLNT